MPKKRYPFWNKDSLLCALLASLAGTYSDLYFVGKGLYYFPHRLLPEVFSINIIFTLIVLPLLTMVFLYGLAQMNTLGKACMILLACLLIPIAENLAERLGAFVHSDQWTHIYSFFGYLLFLTVISTVYFAAARYSDV